MDSFLKTIEANLKNKSAVLELGCGSGELINAVAQKFGYLRKIVAVDFFNRPEKLNGKVEFIKQDIEQLDLPGKFDLVILNQVFEHMKNPLGLLVNLKKNLNPHGRVLIVVPNRYGFNNEARVYLPEHGRHYFLWDKESLEYSLNRIGFTCRFYNLYTAASRNLLVRYLPALLRLQNPNLTCIAMPDEL
jgi:SAM-dependent methyltransferase